MNKKMISGGVALGVLVVSAFAFGGSKSGLKAGENVTPFHPKHVSGPLAGTDKCFPCTFQARPQVQVWINGDDAKNVDAITKNLQAQIVKNKKSDFKALVVILGDEKTSKAYIDWAKATSSKDVAIAVLPKNDEAVSAYKINTAADVKNTVIVYKDWKVAASFVNLTGHKEGLAQLDTAIAGLIK